MLQARELINETDIDPLSDLPYEERFNTTTDGTSIAVAFQDRLERGSRGWILLNLHMTERDRTSKVLLALAGDPAPLWG